MKHGHMQISDFLTCSAVAVDIVFRMSSWPPCYLIAISWHEVSFGIFNYETNQKLQSGKSNIFQQLPLKKCSNM